MSWLGIARLPNSTPVASERIVELDALRGLAALAVVAFHYTTRYDELFGHAQPLRWNVAWGHYGVDLFFMLSGFVILMTLDRSRGWGSFAWGRFSRLYPAYWVAAALTFVVVARCGLPGQETSPGEALLNLTMVQSLLGARHIDGAYWSLQAEVLFYANMLLLHCLGGFGRPLRTLRIWLGVAVLAQAIVYAAEAQWLPPAAAQVSKVVTLASLEFIPLFGLGIVLYVWRTGQVSGRAAATTAALCLATTAITTSAAAVPVVAMLALVLGLAVQGRLPWLGGRWLVYLGAISYPLYLTHQNVGYVIMQHLEAAGVAPSVAIAAAGMVAMLMAALLHHGVERPALVRLRGVYRSLPTPRWLKLREVATRQPRPILRPDFVATQT